MKTQWAPQLLATLAILITSIVITPRISSPWLTGADIPLVEAQATQPATDTRQRVQLTPLERDAIRREMRTLLRSLNRILHGLTDGSAETVEQAARTSGTALALDPQLVKKLPPQYALLDQRTHLRFDQLADANKGGSIRGNAVARLAAITGNCLACHDMFQVDEVP